MLRKPNRCILKGLSSDLRSKYLALFTADSAAPFEVGKYGDEVLCMIAKSVQYCLNSPLNCGPLSLMIILLKPKRVCRESRWRSTAAVCSFVSWKTKK